jgi:hypothetical protein
MFNLTINFNLLRAVSICKVYILIMLWYLVINEPCFDKGGFHSRLIYLYLLHYFDCRSMDRMCYLDPTINTNNVHFL